MQKKWWNSKVAYQIFPKSFYDANGDGIGDLRGVISKLDYLKELGIDIIWLTPIYKSPFVDQGYDVQDYYSIAEEFGTMEDFDELIKEAKKRDIYILMDLVVNHCSDQHEWFQKALEDPDGEYANYFHFAEGRNGGVPNNYRSFFGGGVWSPVPGTNKYYMHLFSKEQPDLNWHNPALRKKMYEMINWWLDKGLGGFRIDAIVYINKDMSYPMFEPDSDDGLVSSMVTIGNREGLDDMLEELKHETFEKYDAFTIGEVFNVSDEAMKKFIGDDGHFSTMFDFSTNSLSFGGRGWHCAKDIEFYSWRDTIFESQTKMQDIGFMANFIENHDEPRGATRYLPEYAHNEAGKKMLASTTVLLRGIPFIYQGQEIGMTNVVRKDVSEYDDVSTRSNYELAREMGYGKEEALKICYRLSRDNTRTPVQWNDDVNAGFTTGTPWLGVNENYKEINVAEQQTRDDSVLNHYKRLIALRKTEEYRETFTYGKFVPAYTEEAYIMAYYRESEETGQRILVVGNYGKKPHTFLFEGTVKKVLLSNMGKENEVYEKIRETGHLTLESCESVVVLL